MRAAFDECSPSTTASPPSNSRRETALVTTSKSPTWQPEISPAGTDRYRIVVFFCAEARLAIGLDGSGHTYLAARIADLDRELELQEKGIRVHRFYNRAVFENLDGVLNAIIYAADPERSLWRTPTVEGTSDAKDQDPHLNHLPQGEETARFDPHTAIDGSTAKNNRDPHA